MPGKEDKKTVTQRKVTVISICRETEGEPEAAFPVSHTAENEDRKPGMFREIGCREWEALREVRTPFVAFLRQGDSYEEGDLGRMCACLEKRISRADAAVPAHPGRKGLLKLSMEEQEAQEKPRKKRRKRARPQVLSLVDIKELVRMPGCLDGMIFRTEAAQRVAERHGYRESVWYNELACEVLLNRPAVVYVPGIRFVSWSPFAGGASRREWTQAAWYLDVMEDFCERMLRLYPGASYKGKLTMDRQPWQRRLPEGEVPLLIQAQIFYILKVHFRENLNTLDKGALSGEEFERYYQSCLRCMRQIRSEFIYIRENSGSPERESAEYDRKAEINGRSNHLESVSGHRERSLPLGQRALFARMKYEADGRSAETVGKLLLPVTMQLMEFVPKGGAQENPSGTDGVLRMDFLAEPYLFENGRRLAVKFGGREIPYAASDRFCVVKGFGHRFERMAFSVEIPYDGLGEGGTLEFYLKDRKKERRLRVMSALYQTRISSSVNHSYWCFGPYMVTFAGNKVKREQDAIRIRRADRAARVLQEMKLLASMPFGKNRSRRMCAMRIGYWMLWPFLHKKNIWLTFDKLYKGGDCGEYFYKYMAQKADPDVMPAYVIRSDAQDRQRLKQEGYRPLLYGTLRHKYMYLYANMIFATHSAVHSFNGFSGWHIQFIQDRLRAVNTCIQHGLSVQDLTVDSNRIVNNNKRYYCASRYEVENLSRPEYDYGRGVLRLTGIPRFDGLVNRDRRQILITPTWRAYIAMPPVMGSARPYNPQFKYTDYFRIYEELITDRRLIETAARTGYRIVYLLHPVLSSQMEDYTVHDGVELKSAIETSYETILTESSLMVTDYSGVQFDFAFMRKPVVYYQPPELPPHYAESGFDYETQGFGEICTDRDTLVSLLCGYMERGCTVDAFYRKRQDDFFAFDDRNNCARIYEDAREFQKNREEAWAKLEAGN